MHDGTISECLGIVVVSARTYLCAQHLTDLTISTLESVVAPGIQIGLIEVVIGAF